MSLITEKSSAFRFTNVKNEMVDAHSVLRNRQNYKKPIDQPTAFYYEEGQSRELHMDHHKDVKTQSGSPPSQT